MRILRITVVILFVITTALFANFYIKEKTTTDNTIPVITVEEEIIEVSFNATEKELLQGVTAYDEKDKDLTDRVIVESVSKFIEDGVCKVVYAVCDSDNNVANATRKIRYKNYVSPVFSVQESLCYSIYDKINISNAIKAQDCIDGDISRNIIVTSEDLTSTIAGVFNIDISVTNSKGDTSTMKLPLVIEDRSLSAPVIELSEYLIYAEKGQEIDFSSYIVAVSSPVYGDMSLDSVRIETNADMNEEGTYSIHYYATDAKEVQGHSILNVVVG